MSLFESCDSEKKEKTLYERIRALQKDHGVDKQAICAVSPKRVMLNMIRRWLIHSKFLTDVIEAQIQRFIFYTRA